MDLHQILCSKSCKFNKTPFFKENKKKFLKCHPVPGIIISFICSAVLKQMAWCWMLQRPRRGKRGGRLDFFLAAALIQPLHGTAEPARETIPRPHRGAGGPWVVPRRCREPGGSEWAAGLPGMLRGLRWEDVSSCFPGLLYKYPLSTTWFSTGLRNSCAADLNTHVRHLRPSSPCFPSPFILGATYPPGVTDQK